MRNALLLAIRQALSPRWFGNLVYKSPRFISSGPLINRQNFLRLGSNVQQRTAITRAKIHLGDSSQHSLEPEKASLGRENEGPTYPAVVQQAYENMRKFDKCVLLTRVGSFYEVGYGLDAVQCRCR